MNRQQLSAILLLVVIGWVLIYPTSWWSWAVAAVPVAGFAYWIARTSRSWLDAIDPSFSELEGSEVPAELEPTMLELSKLGIEYATAFQSHDTGVLMVSPERETVATLRTGFAGDVVLATNWPNGRLQTSRALGIPLGPGEYVQLVPGADLASLVAIHHAGVATLTRGLGEPLVADATVDELVASTQRRRAAFSRRRYRQTAKVVISYAFGRSLRPVDEQLGLQTRLGVLLAMIAALTVVIVYAWWWAGRERTSRAVGTAITSTLVFGGSIAVLLTGMRTRRRFAPPL